MPEDDEETMPGLVLKGGPEAMRPYLGKWVAIEDGEIRASGDGRTVFEEAHRLGMKDPSFMYLPKYPMIGSPTLRGLVPVRTKKK